MMTSRRHFSFFLLTFFPVVLAVLQNDIEKFKSTLKETSNLRHEQYVMKRYEEIKRIVAQSADTSKRIKRDIKRSDRRLGENTFTSETKLMKVTLRNIQAIGKIFKKAKDPDHQRFNLEKGAGWLRAEGFTGKWKNDSLLFTKCFANFHEILEKVVKAKKFSNGALTDSQVIEKSKLDKSMFPSLYIPINYLMKRGGPKKLIAWLKHAINDGIDELSGIADCKARMVIEHRCCAKGTIQPLNPKYREIRVSVG